MRERISIVIAVAVFCAMVGTATAAIVTPSITYQGVLTDNSGNPLNGTYNMTFRLYDVSSGGTALDTNTHPVTVAKGLFTTPVPFDANYFNGRALWIGISVGADAEMTPRQEIRAVPYAHSLRPGALISANLTPAALIHLINVGDGTAALLANTTGVGSISLYGVAQGPSGKGVMGESAEDAGIYGIGREGGFFTTNGAGSYYNRFAGVNVSTEYEYNPGVKINTSGQHGDGVYVITSGNFSEGMRAETSGMQSVGLYANTSGMTSYGVRAETSGLNSKGVFAGTSGSGSEGVYAVTLGDNSDGVYALTSGSSSEGVRTETSGNYSYGVRAETSGSNSEGVYAVTSGSSSEGIRAETSGLNSEGVYAYSNQSHGVYAETNNSASYGIYTPDRLYAGGGVFPATDVAEYMPVVEYATQGTVLVIGDEGKLQVTSIAYDTKVAGIVSTSPGISLGAKEHGNEGEQLIAVAGRVPCKVDASNGPIHPGDLLTTSPTPGHAMKATDPKIGTILGKAMGTLESGTGVIEVLVTLQ